MDDKEFEKLMAALTKYLESEKVFIKNPERFADVERATEIATQLFSDSTVSVDDDPLQLGALIVRIDAFDITIRGEREIKLFVELVSKADNFEIYPVGDEKVCFAILFNHALTRVPQGKSPKQTQ